MRKSEPEYKENYSFGPLEDLDGADLNALLNSNSKQKKSKNRKLMGPEDRESAAKDNDALKQLTSKKNYKDPYKNLDVNRHVLNIAKINPNYDKIAATMDGPASGYPGTRSLQTLEPSSVGMDNDYDFTRGTNKRGHKVTLNSNLGSPKSVRSGSYGAKNLNNGS